MLKLATVRQFEKDLVKMNRRGKESDKLKQVIGQLVNQLPLEPQRKDHSLTGNYANHRECHIEPDWLLIYQLTDEELILVRTGTHSDLFR